MRILVLEDDNNTGSALIRFLTSTGYTAVGSGNAMEAIALIQQTPPGAG